MWYNHSGNVEGHAGRNERAKGQHMKNTIDIDVQIDPACADPKVIIRTSGMTPAIDSLIQAIENASESAYPMVTAYAGDALVLLSQREIVRVYAESRKTVVCTERGGFVARRTLAEMASALNSGRFVRISRSEIINLYKVSRFDFSLSGTIHVHFDDGSSTWVARRYVRAIQEKLGLV